MRCSLLASIVHYSDYDFVMEVCRYFMSSFVLSMQLCAAFIPLVLSGPIPKCDFLQASPFFKKELAISDNNEAREELIFLTEFSRFMNKRAPVLLKASTKRSLGP